MPGWADKLEWVMRAGREPQSLGVCGQIVPWNFPLLMAAWKIAPALACGNTVVLKPAETTPLTALALAQIIEEADLPPGVVNVVTGDGTTGAALVEHPDVDKIAFTGSTEVGKVIARRLGGSDKRLTLELGGKAAHIVFADAPMDQAIEGVVNGIYFNQGHVCCAGSRLLVEERVHDEIVVRLTERLQTLRLGDPLDKNTDIGAINSRAQLEKIEELVRSGVEQGATLVQQQCDLPARGFFFPASFFTNVHQSHRIAREEIFGPVLSILTFRTPDEAVEKANNTPYGLSAGVWTDKGQQEHVGRAAPPCGRRVVQHVQPIRSQFAFWRISRIRLRSRRRRSRALTSILHIKRGLDAGRTRPPSARRPALALATRDHRVGRRLPHYLLVGASGRYVRLPAPPTSSVKRSTSSIFVAPEDKPIVREVQQRLDGTR